MSRAVKKRTSIEFVPTAVGRISEDRPSIIVRTQSQWGEVFFKAFLFFMLMLIHFYDTFSNVENCKSVEIFRETALFSI